MKTNGNIYEGENRSLHMKERIGYGTGDFANNMMYSTVNSFYTYFLTNVVGLGAGVAGTILLISRLMDGVSDLTVGSIMEKVHSKHGKAWSSVQTRSVRRSVPVLVRLFLDGYWQHLAL